MLLSVEEFVREIQVNIQIPRNDQLPKDVKLMVKAAG